VTQQKEYGGTNVKRIIQKKNKGSMDSPHGEERRGAANLKRPCFAGGHNGGRGKFPKNEGRGGG